jgi:hypothetical protein
MHQAVNLRGHNLRIFAVFRALLHKLNHTSGCGKQGVIFTDTHIVTSVELGTALSHNYAASIDFLTAKNFDAETFAL